MGLYYSKDGLYKEVSNLKEYLRIPEYLHGFNLIDILTSRGFIIETASFKTRGLRGLAIIGNSQGEDIILLDKSRTGAEQNFDCGHEMMHLALHRNLSNKTFNCFDNIKSNQSPIIEWQANEGAAEFFVPHKLFLRIVRDRYSDIKNPSSIEQFKKEMASTFNVPETVIMYRLENLKYEIFQFLNGTPLDSIEVLSSRKQRDRKIKIKSLNDLAEENDSSDFVKLFNLTDTEWITHIIIQEWENILLSIGGVIRASLRYTTLEPDSENQFSIIFKDYNSYIIGSRPSIIAELKNYILNRYGFTVQFNPTYGKENNNFSNYLELKKCINLDINILD